jgi:hypothetical protein
LQHRLDAGDHRDGGRGVRSLALGGHYDDHVAFGKILQRDRRRARQQLLNIKAGATALTA